MDDPLVQKNLGSEFFHRWSLIQANMPLLHGKLHATFDDNLQGFYLHATDSPQDDDYFDRPNLQAPFLWLKLPLILENFQRFLTKLQTHIQPRRFWGGIFRRIFSGSVM